MNKDVNISTIAELADLQAGFPFRGAIESSADGDALVVQLRDVDPEHGISWQSVTRTMLTGRKVADWLRGGDVLFIARGARFYAACIEEPPHPAVCSPHFFHLRIKNPAVTDPAFIAWQINQPPFQRQLQQAAEGSSQLSIRRPVLESLTLSVPALADQMRIVALAELARRERHDLEQLMQNRERQLHALAETLYQSSRHPKP